MVLVVLGVVATTVAISFMGLILTEWVDQNAQSMSAAAITNLGTRGADLISGVKLAAESDSLAETLMGDDEGALAAELVLLNQSLAGDNLMLLGPEGRVMASTGEMQFVPGDSPLSAEDFQYISLALSSPCFVQIGDLYTISGSAQMNGPEGRAYTLVLSTVIDDEYLSRISAGTTSALALYSAAGDHVARSVPDELDAQNPELASALESEVAEVTLAIASASEGDLAIQPLQVGQSKYRVVAEQVSIGDGQAVVRGAPYLVTVAGTSVTDQTRTTTTGLIALWSAMAVLTLIGLGIYLARSISRPLEVLSQSAAQVAEGDFTARVDVPGSNELAEISPTTSTA